jgi:polygalacturonase
MIDSTFHAADLWAFFVCLCKAMRCQGISINNAIIKMWTFDNVTHK